jgi:TetR/AcrR family transcriptional repressor of nem operon
MSPKVASKQDTRQALLEAGMKIMLEKGYTNTGIMEVLSSVGVPKGSFYHFFESKEDFALAIIAAFDDMYTTKVSKFLNDPSVPPLRRIKNYCLDVKKTLAEQQCRKGCLVGNLSQEMSDQSEVLRAALSKVMAKRRDLLANCIKEGQKLGEISNAHSADEWAELVQCGWDGAVLRTKTRKELEPIEVFIKLMFDTVLKP